MARATNPSKTRPETRNAAKPGTRPNDTAAKDRRWQRMAAIGTWLDSLARIMEVLFKVR